MGQTTSKFSEEYKNAKKSISDNFNYLDSSVKYLVTVFGVGITTYIFRNEIEHFLAKYFGSQHYKRIQGANNILKPVKFVERSNYVERKEHEERLNNLIGNLNQEKYVVIVGSKGSGKTTLLKHVLNGQFSF
jgi:ABC-type bacteriocin/lantibiotic exporter with double-glycine peptidase domain